ncbi:uncharacterized protein HD556DRAFT_992349 [Suillus plorans]|uniref:Uncharacterized protein n=1 Tax=Suillus plorans TaxID=116603 RepID=A0A9P7DCD9_9AGAM|nr:uncharacterized protein HD556DRAFT_992349 [Suillus plorans]KAG1787132.1 hypothetical protein HD556DRAFT_992349 [Suillus plorans]
MQAAISIRRLHPPCIVFPVTGVRRKPGQNKGIHFTYGTMADGLRDLDITTEDKLPQFSRAMPLPAWRTFLLVLTWSRHLLETHRNIRAMLLSLTYPFHSLSLSHLVLKLHDLLASAKYCHLAICSPCSFRPSQVFENVCILPMYTHTYSKCYSEIPAPRTIENSSNSPRL